MGQVNVNSGDGGGSAAAIVLVVVVLVVLVLLVLSSPASSAAPGPPANYSNCWRLAPDLENEWGGSIFAGRPIRM